MLRNLMTFILPFALLAGKAAINLSEPKPIGGHWSVREGKVPAYFYQDGKRTLDLFSYHASDSNEDGIPNVRMTHDERFLHIASQGYPNHPDRTVSQQLESKPHRSAGFPVSVASQAGA